MNVIFRLGAIAVLTACAFPAWVLTLRRASGADAGTETPAEPSQMQLRLDSRIIAKRSGPWFVGDTVTFGATFRNASPHTIYLPDWEKDDYRDEFSWPWIVYSRTIPGYSSGDYAPPKPLASVGSIPKEDFRALPPKTQGTEQRHEFTLLLPGKSFVAVRYINGFTTYPTTIGTGPGRYKAAGFAPVDFPDAWAGDIAAPPVEIDVTDEMSPEMKARFELGDVAIRDGNKPMKDRVAAMKKIADEKHYFAARFVAKVWKDGSDPAIKEAALGDVLELLEFGTAYQSLPDLLEMLKDDKAPATSRAKLMDLLAKMGLHGKHPGFDINSQVYTFNYFGQIYYELSPELLKHTMDAITTVANGRDPFLAAKAKAILAPPKEKK